MALVWTLLLRVALLRIYTQDHPINSVGLTMLSRGRGDVVLACLLVSAGGFSYVRLTTIDQHIFFLRVSGLFAS